MVKTEKEDSGMKKRHTEEQIIGILNEAQAGMPVADLLRGGRSRPTNSILGFLPMRSLLHRNLPALNQKG